MILNYQKAPIVDIKPLKHCVRPFDETILDTWPGTVAGCYCKDNDQIKRGTCSSQNDFHCKN